MQIYSNTLYNMDEAEFLNNVGDGKIDLILTSPPYNILGGTLTSNAKSYQVGYDVYKDNLSNEDYAKWVVRIFNDFDRVLKSNGVVLWNMSYGSANSECMLLTMSDVLKSTNFTMADMLVWKKSNATPNNMSSNKLTRIVEYVFVMCRRSEYSTFHCNKKVLYENDTGQKVYENLFNFFEAPNNDGANDLNKATFSSEFCSHLLNLYANKGALVCDIFMGTGTTASACVVKGFNFVGSELSERQYNYSCERVDRLLNQRKLFSKCDHNKILIS